MNNVQVVSTALAGVLAVALGLYLYKRKQKGKAKVWHQIGTVGELRIYPVKSCQGITIQQAECTDLGFKYDRHVVIVDSNNQPVTPRSHPQIARIKQEFCDEARDRVILTAPGLSKLEVALEDNKDKEVEEKLSVHLFGLTGDGVPVSAEADRWICDYLGKEGFRILRFPGNGSPRRLCKDKKYAVFSEPRDAVAFSDKCPYLMISDASLGALNDRFPNRNIPMERFRPNIIMTQSQPFEEDDVKHLKIGTAEFRGLHRCGRCIMTTVDPETGTKEPEEPLKTLREFRLVPKEEDWRFGNSPVFGKNLGLAKAGIISAGDVIYAAQ